MVYGFIFDQSDVIDRFGLGIEEATAEDFRSYQATLRAISDETGVVFDDLLHRNDVFALLAPNESMRRVRDEDDVIIK